MLAEQKQVFSISYSFTKFITGGSISTKVPKLSSCTNRLMNDIHMYPFCWLTYILRNLKLFLIAKYMSNIKQFRVLQ